ncbi:MAG: agmatinase [Bacteroidales bacterium]|nr:agmatinase [Bacteroidales bacterium]
MEYFLDMDAAYASYEKAEFVLLPVPYDGTSTYVKGADKGPQAIIDASDSIELYDPEEEMEVYLHGIHTAKPVTENATPEAMVEAVKRRTLAILNDGKLSVVLGGEHSVTVGSVRAYAEKYPQLSVLQLDAHADMRDAYQGSPYNHACVMKRVKEVCPVVQVGIRSVCIEEKAELDAATTVYAHQLHTDTAWMERAAAGLSPQVYLTVDLDAFDPSVLPSTGTPFPGGMAWRQVLDFIDYVLKEHDIVGFDVVELCPNPQAKASDVLAAVLVYKIIAKIVKKREACK